MVIPPQLDLLKPHPLPQMGRLACPPPKELHERWSWDCTFVPEDLSPRSFRSIIDHNTNVWASKSDDDLMRLSGTVGMMDLNDPPDKYTGRSSVLTIGVLCCMVASIW